MTKLAPSKKVVVTGGLGFIGSNLVDYLVSIGYSVLVLDVSANTKYSNTLARYYNVDITQPIENSDDIFSGVDTIFHLAAEIEVQKSLLEPELFKNTNYYGTMNMLNYAVQYGIKNFIFSSTAGVYGNTYYDRPSLETDTTDCLNAYSQSKLDAENTCEVYAFIYSMNISILRYFNVYGNRQHETGQYAPVIGRFLQQRQLGTPLTVVGDGAQTRDFVQVDDVVKANYLAHINNVGYNVYNIGSGVEISIIDLATLISDNIEFIERRDNECAKSVADTSKAEKELGWMPTASIHSYINNVIHQ